MASARDTHRAHAVARIERARKRAASTPQRPAMETATRAARGSADPRVRALRPLTGALRGRLTADLDDRDPDYIRENLPFAWLLSTLWFRGEVRGMDRIPERSGPSCSSATTPAAT